MPVSREALVRLQRLAVVNLNDAGDVIETDPADPQGVARAALRVRRVLPGAPDALAPDAREDRAVSSFLPDIDPERVPAHVAIVMDGNGRWATQRGLQRTDGHAAGEEALADTVEGGVEVGLKWLTVYAFSSENWRRPAARGPLPDELQPEAAAPPSRPVPRAERPDPVHGPSRLARPAIGAARDRRRRGDDARQHRHDAHDRVQLRRPRRDRRRREADRARPRRRASSAPRRSRRTRSSSGCTTRTCPIRTC